MIKKLTLKKLVLVGIVAAILFLAFSLINIESMLDNVTEAAPPSEVLLVPVVGTLPLALFFWWVRPRLTDDKPLRRGLLMAAIGATALVMIRFMYLQMLSANALNPKNGFEDMTSRIWFFVNLCYVVLHAGLVWSGWAFRRGGSSKRAIAGWAVVICNLVSTVEYLPGLIRGFILNYQEESLAVGDLIEDLTTVGARSYLGMIALLVVLIAVFCSLPAEASDQT